MKRVQLLLTAMLLATTGLMAQDFPVGGKWLLTKVEMDGKTQDIYTDVEFRNDGYAEMGGRVFGNWEYNSKTKQFTIKSEMIKEFAGIRKVATLNAETMIMADSKTKLFFIKLDPEKTKVDNKNSGLEGIWKTTKNDEGLTSTIVFELPNKFTFTEISNGYNSTAKGEWIFNPAEKTVLIMTGERSFNGINKIAEISSEKLVLKHSAQTTELSKYKKPNIEVVRLNFSESDFYTEDGDYKYSADVEKLPWEDQYRIIESLGKIKQLVYNYYLLDENSKAFEEKTLTANIITNTEEESVRFDNIFTGVDKATIGDDEDMPRVNFSYDNPLFPFKHNTFRVAGKEKIKTPAGIFNCTVVETIGNFDEQIKFWMIDNNPGVVAKAILDKPGSFGYYKVFVLKE
jgi:hypothetical protein